MQLGVDACIFVSLPYTLVLEVSAEAGIGEACVSLRDAVIPSYIFKCTPYRNMLGMETL
jgi:hypothetical protein